MTKAKRKQRDKKMLGARGGESNQGRQKVVSPNEGGKPKSKEIRRRKKTTKPKQGRPSKKKKNPGRKRKKIIYKKGEAQRLGPKREKIPTAEGGKPQGRGKTEV